MALRVAVSHAANVEIKVYKAFSMCCVWLLRLGNVTIKPLAAEVADVFNFLIDANVRISLKNIKL